MGDNCISFRCMLCGEGGCGGGDDGGGDGGGGVVVVAVVMIAFVRVALSDSCRSAIVHVLVVVGVVWSWWW